MDSGIRNEIKPRVCGLSHAGACRSHTTSSPAARPDNVDVWRQRLRGVAGNPSSEWRHWRCLALSGAVWRACVPACNPPSASKTWGTGLAVVAPGLIPCAFACLESPMARPWFPVIGVPAPHQTGPPTRTLHDDDHNPDVYFVLLALVCWEWFDAQITATRCHSSAGPCNPSTRLLASRAPSLPPFLSASCMLRRALLPLAAAFCRCLPLPRAHGHVSWTCAHSTLPQPLGLQCSVEVNGRPHAWLLLDRVPDRSTRGAFRGPTYVGHRRPLPLPQCSF